MERNIVKLTDRQFDLVIVGGGIYGAVLSWQAALTGLSVALIEKGDFAQATSANSQKIIHGGLRYLQNFDISRTLRSLNERNRMMCLAPHLVHPLPCIMPIYGHGIKGREVMSLGLKFYNFLNKKQNDYQNFSKFFLKGKVFSKSEISEMIPGVNPTGLLGGARWCDAYCYNTERLVLAFIKSASRRGCVAANYVRADKLIAQANSVIVESHDQINDQNFDIVAKKLINCTGPWFFDLIDSAKTEKPENKLNCAIGVNIITKPLFPHQTAIGLKSRIDRRSRLYFVLPWRGKSIIGTEWFANDRHPDQIKPQENQCIKLIDGFNSAYPPARLSLEDVSFVHTGLVPRKTKLKRHMRGVILKNHSKLIDHSKDGFKGVVSIIGVKYTTAGDVAARTLDYLFPKIKKPPIRPQHKLLGGEIEDFWSFQNNMQKKLKSKIDKDELHQLTLNYGTETENVVEKGKTIHSVDIEKKHFSYDIVKGETLFAIEEEMAQTLDDVIMRRTQKGTAGFPLESELEKMSHVMAKELGWDESRKKLEIEEVLKNYPPFISREIKDERNKHQKNSTIQQWRN